MDEFQKAIDEVLGDPAVFEQFTKIINELTAAFTCDAEGLAGHFRILAEHAGAACGSIFSMKIRNNLTRRQYHLYRHGRPRVRKKWENAAIRRAKKAERRKTHV